MWIAAVVLLSRTYRFIRRVLDLPSHVVDSFWKPPVVPPRLCVRVYAERGRNRGLTDVC